MFSINILGVVWVVLLLVSFNNKMYFTIALTIISVIFQKVLVFAAGDVTITIVDISAIVLMLRWLIISKGRIRLPRVDKFVVWMFVVFFSQSMLSGIIFNGYGIKLYNEWYGLYQIGTDYLTIDTSLIIVLIRLLLYCLVYLAISSYARQNTEESNEKYILKIIEFSVYVVLAIGAIQLLNYYGVADFDWMMRVIHDPNQGGSAYYSNYNRMYSCFAEPSYCAPWLNAAFWAMMYYKNENMKKGILLGLLLIGFLLSASFTGYIAFVVMYLLYVFQHKSKKAFCLNLVIIFGVFVILLATHYGDYLLEMIGKKIQSSSGLSRLDYIFDCYRVFKETNFFGVGYMQIKSMTLISGLLAQVGVIGTIVFVVMIVRLLLRKPKTNVQMVAKIFFIASVIGGEISCSGLHWLAPFWFGLFLFALANMTENIDKIYRKNASIVGYAENEKEMNYGKIQTDCD